MTTPLAVPWTVRAPSVVRLGLFTTEDLAAAGVSEREVRTAVRRRTWVRLRTGCFVTAAHLEEVSSSGRVRGLDALAVLTSLGRDSCVLSHDTAAWVWGLPLPARAPRTVRLTDPLRWRSGRGWTMGRARLPTDEVTTRGVYPVTTPARTLVDVARSWSEIDAVAAVDDALRRGLTTSDELARTLERQAVVPRIPRSRRAVELADGRAESWLETKGRLRFHAAGLPAFLPQVELWLGDRLVKVADGWYEDQALAVELDGRSKYVSPRFESGPTQVLFLEKRREDLLRAHGVRFVRLVDDDLGTGWDASEQQIRRALALAGPVTRTFRAVPRTLEQVRAASAVPHGVELGHVSDELSLR